MKTYELETGTRVRINVEKLAEVVGEHRVPDVLQAMGVVEVDGE